MELRQLNKIVLLLALAIGINTFSQMKMADVEGKKFLINLKTEKQDIIKILDNNSYSVFYILDRRRLNVGKGIGTADMVNLIFFSKNYNKGVLVTFKQLIEHSKKSSYNITLLTGSYNKSMFISSMIIVDKNFNYEYLMKYYYMPLPPPKSNVYTSSITIQNILNYCQGMQTELKENLINENIDDILSNIFKININENKSKECNPLISDSDLKYFFPKRIGKNGLVYYKK